MSIEYKGQTLAEVALEVARTQLGVEEVPRGSNGGPQVTTYLKSIGLGPGFPWCAAFVYWCVNRAANILNVPNPLVKTGGVLRQWNETKLRKFPARSASVKPGDVFIMDYGKGLGHTGFVVAIRGGIAVTIEGNTNADGSREGFAVCTRERPLSAFRGVISIP